VKVTRGWEILVQKNMGQRGLGGESIGLEARSIVKVPTGSRGKVIRRVEGEGGGDRGSYQSANEGRRNGEVARRR